MPQSPIDDIAPFLRPPKRPRWAGPKWQHDLPQPCLSQLRGCACAAEAVAAVRLRSPSPVHRGGGQISHKLDLAVSQAGSRGRAADKQSRKPDRLPAIMPLTWYFLATGAGFERATSGL
jgi:hypothetical protein